MFFTAMELNIKDTDKILSFIKGNRFTSEDPGIHLNISII